MVNKLSKNREFTGICLELGTVERAKELGIKISPLCNAALHEEIAKREREERRE